MVLMMGNNDFTSSPISAKDTGEIKHCSALLWHKMPHNHFYYLHLGYTGFFPP
jgi:hypothetical protein